MVLPKNIEDAIEQEIENRANEKITKLLEIISRNYNIKYSRLLSDLASMNNGTQSSNMCCGITKTGKRCQRTAKENGYCLTHKNQKPDVRVTRSSPPKVSHTHTIPPLFLKGCPACESSKQTSSAIFKS